MAQYRVSVSLGTGGIAAKVGIDANIPVVDGQTIDITPSGVHALHWIFYGPAGTTLIVTLTPIAGGASLQATDSVPPLHQSEAGVQKFTVP